MSVISCRGRVYYDSTRRVFSVVLKRLVAHKAANLFINDVKPVILKAGQSRTRSQGKKFVHAFLEGVVEDAAKKKKGRRIFYNPYKNDTFVFEDGSEFKASRWAHFTVGPSGPIVTVGD